MIRNQAVKHFDFDTKPATPAEEALQVALSARLKEIAEKPITARTLIEMETFSRIAREMLIAGKAPGQVRRNPYSNIGNYGIVGGYDGDDLVMAPSSGQENFGMTAIREGTGMIGQLMALAGQLVERHGEAETVKAIAAARKEGLIDVAAKLEARLFDDKKVKFGPEALLAAPKVEGVPGIDTTEDDGTMSIEEKEIGEAYAIEAAVAAEGVL